MLVNVIDEFIDCCWVLKVYGVWNIYWVIVVQLLEWFCLFFLVVVLVGLLG